MPTSKYRWFRASVWWTLAPGVTAHPAKPSSGYCIVQHEAADHEEFKALTRRGFTMPVEVSFGPISTIDIGLGDWGRWSLRRESQQIIDLKRKHGL